MSSASTPDQPRRAQPRALPHPLGPCIVRTRRHEHRSVRRRAAVILVAAASVLGVARWLNPDDPEMPMNRQLGIPACSWMTDFGIPCPTCGMTTAFAESAHGHWLRAIVSQPAGWLEFVLVCILGLVSLVELVTGTGWRINWYRLRPGRAVIVAVSVVLLSWAYKVLASQGLIG